MESHRRTVSSEEKKGILPDEFDHIGRVVFFFLQFMGKPEAEVVKNHRKLGKYSKKSNY